MTDGTTHWGNCYAFGPKHYDCLLAEAARRGDEIKRLREALTIAIDDYESHNGRCLRPEHWTNQAKGILAGAVP